MSGSDGFLGRWSRRKALTRESNPAPAEPQESNVGGGGEGPEVDETTFSAVPADRDRVAERELPDIETLGRDSDFTVFMQRGVPDALQKQALRKLWRLDPAFSKLDGLVEYGEDYNAPARRPGLVKTAWRIGRGMAGPEAVVEGEGAKPERPERERLADAGSGEASTCSKEAGQGDGGKGDPSPS